MQKLIPSLWFDKNAEEAMEYYISVFNGAPYKKEDSKIDSIKRYPEGASDGPMKDMGGKVLTGIFELDYFWGKLSHVKDSEQCGWCKDRFGFSWQIVPANMGELIEAPKALQAMLKMHKINIKELEEAAKA
jgi:predicted 3-demethylubiquinone-9 3-methyltransferase (glyoxalase superfamily)